mgnify:CR=1 FL=1
MNALVWVLFLGFVVAILLLDLGVFHRKPKALTFLEASAWSVFWVALGLGFNVLVFFLYEHNWVGVGLAFPEDISGRQAALEFLTAYLLEKTLSLDNIFVIALIFSHFRIPLQYQHRLLFWGIFGALVMRGGMIAAGAAAIHRFEWVTYIFGMLVLITAARLIVVRHDNIDPSTSIFTRVVSKFVPVTDGLRGDRLTVVEGGRRMATPLLVALIMIEGSDLMFAVDSVPAVFAVTDDVFLVYSSNVFAILGLRSLYFTLAPLLEQFRFVRPTLVLILAFVGLKMLAFRHFSLPVEVSLGVIFGILAAGILASIFLPERTPVPVVSPVAAERRHLLPMTRRASVVLVSVSAFVTLAAVGATIAVAPELRVEGSLFGVVVLFALGLWARGMSSDDGARTGGS